MKSICCESVARLARAASGWWINGELVTEWYECTECREPCDIIECEQKGARNDGTGLQINTRTGGEEESEQGQEIHGEENGCADREGNDIR